jgi:hypothetical protein
LGRGVQQTVRRNRDLMKAIGKTCHRFAPTGYSDSAVRSERHRCGDIVFNAIIDDHAGPDLHNLRSDDRDDGRGNTLVRRMTIALPRGRSRDSVPAPLNVMRQG